jgi:hypothetical protein
MAIHQFEHSKNGHKQNMEKGKAQVGAMAVVTDHQTGLKFVTQQLFDRL